MRGYEDRIFDFQHVKTIRSLGTAIMNDAITFNDAQEEQIQLKYAIDNFNAFTRPKDQNKNDKKNFLLEE